MSIKIKLACVIVLLQMGCKAPIEYSEPDAELNRAVVLSVIDELVLPEMANLAERVSALEQSLRQLVLTRQSLADDSAVLQEAQVVFRGAFLTWQSLELVAFGPAGRPPTFSQGLGLRDNIYAWPVFNGCRIDTALVDRRYEDSAYFESAAVSASGLAALEYLLYSNGDANACPLTASINADGGWAALGATERAMRRAHFAEAVAKSLTRQTLALQSAWQAYRPLVDAAGRSGAVYVSTKGPLDELYASLFGIDKLVKDAKLGAPVALAPTCSKAACPELAESVLAGLSKSALQANIRTASLVFDAQGRAGRTGFDALLRAKGAESLVVQIDDALSTAQMRIDALPGPVHELVLSDPESVVSAHMAVKSLTDLLKNELVTVLSVRVPAEGAGDND